MITDRLEVHFNEKRKKYYINQGVNETLYNLVTNEWILFDTEVEALAWIQGYLFRKELWEMR